MDIQQISQKLLIQPTSEYFAFFTNDSVFEHVALTALNTIWLEFEDQLLRELSQNGIEGDYAEFGIWKGDRLKRHRDSSSSRNEKRSFLGFDSFQGLSKPEKDKDVEYFEEGMFEASFDQVSRNLDLENNPNTILFEGWLEDSLLMPPANKVGKIAFALIDTDLYSPCTHALAFLENRLTDQSILAFDDWTYDSQKGETRAFLEFAQQNHELEFELLAAINYRVYFRVKMHHGAGIWKKSLINSSSIMNLNNRTIWKIFGR
jgi:hypothetical protein